LNAVKITKALLSQNEEIGEHNGVSKLTLNREVDSFYKMKAGIIKKWKTSFVLFPMIFGQLS